MIYVAPRIEMNFEDTKGSSSRMESGRSTSSSNKGSHCVEKYQLANPHKNQFSEHEKYEEIAKFLAGTIFNSPNNRFPKIFPSRSLHMKTWKFWSQKVAKIWIVVNNAPF